MKISQKRVQSGKRREPESGSWGMPNTKKLRDEGETENDDERDRSSGVRKSHRGVHVVVAVRRSLEIFADCARDQGEAQL